MTQGGRHMKPKSSEMPMRPCMKCRKPFESEWIGNRLCQLCKGYTGIEIISDNAYGKSITKG